MTNNYNLISSNTTRLNSAESRFVLFMATVQHPIDNQKIIDWYRKYVMQVDSFWARQETLDLSGDPSNTWRSGTATRILNEYAIDWFDRRLGSAIRKGLSFKKQDYNIIPTGNSERYFLLEQINS